MTQRAELPYVADRMYAAFDVFRSMDQDLTATQIQAFLWVARKTASPRPEFPSQVDIAEGLGATQPTTSRAIKVMADELGLIRVDRDAREYRTKRHSLTQKGATILARLADILGVRQ